MTIAEQHVLDFYTRHPISAEHIRMRVREKRGTLDELKPEELYPFDQDHYGGLDANIALAKAAGMTPGDRVADFCAGLGGPARWWARQYGVSVTGVELNPARVRGATELTRLVDLDRTVTVVEGNVLSPPLEDGAYDVVVSQEAFLHIPDKGEALRQAFRVLRPGGRLAFTDWVMHVPLSADEAEDMWNGIAAQTLQTVEGYRALLGEAGFTGIAFEDLTGEWGRVLAERLEMFRALRAETLKAGTPSGEDSFYDSYVRLVGHVQARKLGGARITAMKPTE
ncbi:MAG: methyltransferase domain-containing protein [Rhodobiaceae bacterium]|nr:methyltransferase domain-containing protein [Rhodobiaceae bacterium]